jgi:hypothetical protein
MSRFSDPRDVYSARSIASNRLALLVAALSMLGAAAGAIFPDLYGSIVRTGMISERLAYSSAAQDLTILPVSALLIVTTILFFVKKNAKLLILNLGIVWCEFYAFGLYVMQGQYTSIYILYLAVFSLSIFSLILGVSALASIGAEAVSLSRGRRVVIAAFLLLIVVCLGSLWLARLVPESIAHAREETYGVFVMDLSIVFPAFAVIAIMLIRNRPFFILLAGIALAKTFMLCLTWGFAEYYTAIKTGGRLAMEMALTSTTLMVIAGVLFIPYFRGLKIGEPDRRLP